MTFPSPETLKVQQMEKLENELKLHREYVVNFLVQHYKEGLPVAIEIAATHPLVWETVIKEANEQGWTVKRFGKFYRFYREDFSVE